MTGFSFEAKKRSKYEFMFKSNAKSVKKLFTMSISKSLPKMNDKEIKDQVKEVHEASAQRIGKGILVN